jgi:L-amino acid N-acyltransferase YncA
MQPSVACLGTRAACARLLLPHPNGGNRFAYRHSVESTIYLLPEATGQRIGSQLYRELLSELKGRGFDTVIGGIALPNDASVALHEKLGFEKVARV